ncbi:MAG: hypothetical protein Q9217_003205 [Psora testacea]
MLHNNVSVVEPDRFKQIICDIAQRIAATYPTDARSVYEAAAQTLRIPYWDWALNATMPTLVNEPTISITTPNGTSDITNYSSTVRYPNNETGESQPDLANRQLRSNAESLRELTYQLITDQSNYAPFSNTGYSDERGGQYNSIENIHDTIHQLVGNGGHMGKIQYSAFDPIFWLHHANVDRLIAIWQAINPDSYVTPQVNALGTFTDEPGASEDTNTPLAPFRSDSSDTLYTSTTARDTRTFGYTYPEIIDWGVSRDQLSSNVRSNLNILYNRTNGLRRKRSLPTTTTLDNATTGYEYFANIRVAKSALNAPFFIHFYLHEPNTPVAQYSFAPNLIASYSVLYAQHRTPEWRGSGGNSTIRRTPTSTTTTTATMTYGQIPLNHAFLASLGRNFTDLSPTSVIPFLSQALVWKIQKDDDSLVDASSPELDSLRIFVVGKEVTYNEAEDKFPDYGKFEMYREASKGKVGGIREGDGI